MVWLATLSLSTLCVVPLKTQQIILILSKPSLWSPLSKFPIPCSFFPFKIWRPNKSNGRRHLRRRCRRPHFSGPEPPRSAVGFTRPIPSWWVLLFNFYYSQIRLLFFLYWRLGWCEPCLWFLLLFFLFFP